MISSKKKKAIGVSIKVAHLQDGAKDLIEAAALGDLLSGLGKDRRIRDLIDPDKARDSTGILILALEDALIKM